MNTSRIPMKAPAAAPNSSRNQPNHVAGPGPGPGSGPGRVHTVVQHHDITGLYPEDANAKYLYVAPTANSYAVRPTLMVPENRVCTGNSFAVGSQMLPVQDQPQMARTYEMIPQHVLVRPNDASIGQPANYVPVAVQGARPGDRTVRYVDHQAVRVEAAQNATYAASGLPRASRLPYSAAAVNYHAGVGGYDRRSHAMHLINAGESSPSESQSVVYVRPGQGYDARQQQVLRSGLPDGDVPLNSPMSHATHAYTSSKPTEAQERRYVFMPQESVQVLQKSYPSPHHQASAAVPTPSRGYWAPFTSGHQQYVSNAMGMANGLGKRPRIMQRSPPVIIKGEKVPIRSAINTMKPQVLRAPSRSTKKASKRKKACQFESCEKYTQGGTKFCISHGGGKRCKREGCKNSANSSTDFCISHGGGKRCNYPDCKTSARGNTGFCINHGGGRRCIVPQCKKAALSFGNTCKEHGGGRRCACFGCSKTPRSRTAFCVSHGGGKRCAFDGCSKSAVGRTDTCIQHGGGKRCVVNGCSKSAILPGSRCVAHGGGRRCQQPGCRKAARSALQYCRKCSTQLAKQQAIDALKIDADNQRTIQTNGTAISNKSGIGQGTNGNKILGKLPIKLESSEMPAPKRLKRTDGGLSKPN